MLYITGPVIFARKKTLDFVNVSEACGAIVMFKCHFFDENQLAQVAVGEASVRVRD